MIDVKIEVSGLDIRTLRLETPIRRLVEESADFAEKTMKEKAPVKTGKLRRSIRKRVGRFEAEIGPTVPYAVYVEYGARPHTIRSVRAKALRFEADGTVVFTQLVRHPGTKPQHFIRETVEELRDRIPRLVSEVFRLT